MNILTCILSSLLVVSYSASVIAAQRSEEIALPAVENMQKQLISAAKAGDANRIRILLAQGALLCQKDSSGRTPFDWAAIYGHVACLQIFLDELENNTPLDRRDEYYETLKGIKMHHVDLGIFQRDPQSTEIRCLAPFLLRMYDHLGDWGHEIPGCQNLLITIYYRIRDQLSLNIVLNYFSSGDNVLQQALLAAGAHRETGNLDHLFNPLQGPRSILRLALLCAGEEPDTNRTTPPPSKEKIREYHLSSLMRFAIREEHLDLLSALIAVESSYIAVINEVGPFNGMPPLHWAAWYDRTSMRFAIREVHLDLLSALIAVESSYIAVINAVGPFNGMPPLHWAAWYNRTRIARLLLDAGAPVDRQHGSDTAFRFAYERKSNDVAQVLFESGASIKDEITRQLGIRHLGKHPYFKMLLQGSKLRYAPTKNDAKIAMQNVASLIYILGIKCNLPPYVIYEIILFATGEKKNDQGQPIAPEWTRSLKKSLAVLYLYKCNGNKLFPLWEQTIKCLAKDPQQQALVISKLENFIRPFLGNDVLRLACMHFMQKIANDAHPLQQSTYENDFFGEDFELYYKHLKGSGYLAINGADAP